jgi:drug/metabolite transporter (DMT)-like permease
VAEQLPDGVPPSPSAPGSPQATWRGLIYVGAAVFFFSTSPVFIRWADPLNPFVKTSGRMLVAAAALGVAVLLTRRGQRATPSAGAPRPRRQVLLRFLGYGAIAALHFLGYVAALSFTTPAQTLAIIYTAPIFVAGFAALFLHEPIRRRQWLGIAVAVLGIAVLALGKAADAQAPNPLLGDGLALGSAITFGLYSVAGRYERAHTALLPYAAGVYGVAALWLLPAAVLAWPADVGAVPPGAWGVIVALGLLPLALGHTLYNASLRRVRATTVNVIATQEVTGGILLSWLLLGVAPAPNEVLGVIITLVGILVVLL